MLLLKILIFDHLKRGTEHITNNKLYVTKPGIKVFQKKHLPPPKLKCSNSTNLLRKQKTLHKDLHIASGFPPYTQVSMQVDS